MQIKLFAAHQMLMWVWCLYKCTKHVYFRLFYYFFFLQKNEIKLEELLREVKSLRDLVTLQDRRIAKLEEQVAKVAVWGAATSLSQYFKRYILEGQLLPKKCNSM